MCRWSFAPTAECYLRTLLLAAPTSKSTWDSCFACGGCKKFCMETPKKLQGHLGKCKEALAAKVAAELVASQNETSKEEKE